MSFIAGIPIIGKVIEKGLGIVDKLVKDKDLAEQLKAELTQTAMEIDHSELKEQAKIVLGEIGGESWLQRNWRPLLMLLAMIIVANNYILFPYLALFFPGKVTILVLPTWLADLLKIGVGGYVVGRTAEKVAKTKWGNGNGD